MKSVIYLSIIFVCVSVTLLEARGGRGRGGLFGGISSSWRKTKSKSTRYGSSGGRSSSNVAYSNIQTSKPISNTFSKSHTPNLHVRDKGFGAPISASNWHSNYHAQLPPGSTFHANPAHVPAGALYYPHPPPRTSSSSDLSDFFMGYMTGRLLTSFHGHHMHVYQQQAPDHAGRTVIIINNGTVEATNAVQTAQIYWPTDSLVPLMPFNDSLTNKDLQYENKEPYFKEKPPNEIILNQPISTEVEKTENNPSPAPPGGIICMPMIFNETDASDQTKIVQVEKIVCFPAPPPPPPPVEQRDGMMCVPRTFIEADPNDPTKTVEVQKPHCTPISKERLEPVAGDITTEEYKQAS